MLVRWVAVMRGTSRPLTVLVRSSRALALGVVVPTPTRP